MTREPDPFGVWIVTLVMAALLIIGTNIAQDMAVAQMFGYMGGVTLPLVSALHFAVGNAS